MGRMSQLNRCLLQVPLVLGGFFQGIDLTAERLFLFAKPTNAGFQFTVSPNEVPRLASSAAKLFYGAGRLCIFGLKAVLAA